MELKKKILFTLLLLFFLVIGVVSASDNTTKGMVSSDLTNGDTITYALDDGVGEKTNTITSTGDDLKESSDSKNIKTSTQQEDSTKDIKSSLNTDQVLSSNNGEFVDINDAFKYLNEFRAEEGVWYWNEDDTTKTVYNTDNSNQLQPLRWSSALEETARIRAKELVEKFSHTRPDGTKPWTAYPDGLLAKGENIAYGYTTCYSVTTAWKETNDPYSGQGHRRNMLNPGFNCVGIAGYKVGNIIYWVQCFGYKKGIENEKIEYPKPITNTQDATTNASTTANKITITVTKSPKTVSKKAKKLILTATVKMGKKALNKKTVRFIIKGKTYKVKTNKKGVAKLKLNKKQLTKILKKVKAGKKLKYQIKYGKKTVIKYLKVKK